VHKDGICSPASTAINDWVMRLGNILTILIIMANIECGGSMKHALSSKRESGRQRDKKAPEVDPRERATYSHGRSYTATEAKNEFGRVLDQAIQGSTVVITKHDTPRAVLISMDKFNALQQAPQLKLNTLSTEFDALLARMQTAPARAGMKRAFNASAEQLGKAAVGAARKRG
jgi:prevent-host-death family protein